MSKLSAMLDVVRAGSNASALLLLRARKTQRRSLRAEWVARLARLLLQEAEHEPADWLRARQALLRIPGPALSKVTFAQQVMAGVSCLVCQPNQHQTCAPHIVYFHGGGYVVGSADDYRYTLAELASRLHTTVIAPDYRLAPEFPVPAAQNDCQHVLSAVFQENENRVVLMGDSAGGALVLDVLRQLEEEDKSRISGLALFSPWVSPGRAEGLLDEADADDFLSADILNSWLKQADPYGCYRERLDFSNMQHMPVDVPVLVQSGGLEIMQPQIAQFVAHLRHVRAHIDWQEYEGLFHVFQTLAPLVPEANLALQDLAVWWRERILEVDLK